MKKTLCYLVTLNLLAGILICLPALYAGETKLVGTINQCTEVMEGIMQVYEKSIPTSLMRKCEAIAIFPGVIKGGFMVGGRGGTGVVVARDKATREWGAPSFYIIGGASLGLQFGVQLIDLIVIMPNRRTLQRLVKDKVTLGGDAAVAAGPVGRDVALSTDMVLKGGFISYSRTRGLFFGVTLKGSVLQPDDEANKSYYGRDITAESILVRGEASAPSSARPLIETLNKYSR